MAGPTRLVTLLAVLFLAAGCTSDDGATTESTTTTAAPSTTTAPTTTMTEPARPDRFDEIEALINTYLDSWETKDEAALRASVTDSLIVNEYWYTLKGTLVEEINAVADDIVEFGFGYDWQNEIVGEPTVVGDGPWIVTYRELWQEQSEHLDGIATYVVIIEDGELKIANHNWAGVVLYED